MKFEPIHRHYFADQQFCLKCGKWECAEEENDCFISDEDYEPIRLWEFLKSEHIRLRKNPDEWLEILKRYAKVNHGRTKTRK